MSHKATQINILVGITRPILFLSLFSKSKLFAYVKFVCKNIIISLDLVIKLIPVCACACVCVCVWVGSFSLGSVCLGVCVNGLLLKKSLGNA